MIFFFLFRIFSCLPACLPEIEWVPRGEVSGEAPTDSICFQEVGPSVSGTLDSLRTRPESRSFLHSSCSSLAYFSCRSYAPRALVKSAAKTNTLHSSVFNAGRREKSPDDTHSVTRRAASVGHSRWRLCQQSSVLYITQRVSFVCLPVSACVCVCLTDEDRNFGRARG